MSKGFWDKYGESTTEETAFTGGARVVGRVKIELGYKLYISGADPNWFPVSDPTDKDGRKAQLTAANKVRAETGFEGNSRRPQYGIQITRYTGDTAQLNDDDPDDVKWDQIDWTPKFLTENVDARLTSHSVKSVRIYNWETKESMTVPVNDLPKRAFDLLVESLDEHGIDPAPAWEGYITLWFHDDPDAVCFGESAMSFDSYRKKDMYPQFVTVSGAWTTEKEAHAAVMKLRGTETSTPASSSDEDWDQEIWSILLPEMEDRKVGGMELTEIAEKYKVPGGIAALIKHGMKP